MEFNVPQELYLLCLCKLLRHIPVLLVSATNFGDDFSIIEATSQFIIGITVTVPFTPTSKTKMFSKKDQAHFVLFPLMAQGHLIPMVDIAKLLAQRGVIITIVTTPVNAARCKSTVVRAVESGLNIQLVEVQFPTSAESGLPPGCEAVDMLPASSMHLWHKFVIEANKLEEQVEHLFEKLQPEPSCIISDFCLTCTVNIARKFNVPRISFHGTGCFTLLCLLITQQNKSFLESITSDSDLFALPGLPDEIKFAKSQLLPRNAGDESTRELWNKMIGSDLESFGVVVNSFEELEPTFAREYNKLRGSKVWCIGPVSLCNQDNLDKTHRGNKFSIDQQECITWLDSQQINSVIYGCLGSLCNLPCSQLIELGLALESSMRPFILAIRGSEILTEFENWNEANGFEDRIKGRGILIRGWAPQVLILSHSAVGGFITHCGWNSTIEGVATGVPLLTWPLFGDQFYNEKLIVEVVRIGVRVGVEFPNVLGLEERKHGVCMSKEEIKKAIEKLMDEGEEGSSRRERARELAKIAKHAIDGGSSYLNTEIFIQDVLKQAQIMRER